MTKEFNLSEQEDTIRTAGETCFVFYEEDVKEFIRKIKEFKEDEEYIYIPIKVLDKLAGDKLTQ